ncbi:hypothetical protein B0H14DRAFT_3154197 [Mycena olivaceomarginata]|nr:hypothetical protein B0H14DRAFT_3154197 [Mycena olivaceomarginata]
MFARSQGEFVKCERLRIRMGRCRNEPNPSRKLPSVLAESMASSCSFKDGRHQQRRVIIPDANQIITTSANVVKTINEHPGSQWIGAGLIRMDIPLLSNPDFCGPNRMVFQGDGFPLRSLVTLKSLLSDRAFTVKRPRQQPPSLIFTLPAEMLAEMFLQVTDDQDPASLLNPMHSHFVLTRVCALWRAVAIYTPSLWCRVVLHLGGRTTGFSSITSLAKTCFDRSRELPLALIITSSVTDSSSIPNLSMDLVLPVRHRIRHLELKLPVVFTESIFKLPRNSLKALRSISACAMISDAERAWFRSMSALEGAPVLESVKLSCGHAPNSVMQWRIAETILDPHLAGLPWERLTELVIQDMEVLHEDALYALEMTTSLVRCGYGPPDHRTIGARPRIYQSPVHRFPRPRPRSRPRRRSTSQTPETREITGTSHPRASGERRVQRSHRFLRQVNPPLPEGALDQIQGPAAPPARRSRCTASALASRTGDSLLPFLERNPLLSRLQLVFCAVELTPLVHALTLQRKSDNDEGGTQTQVPLLPDLRLLLLADRWMEEAPAARWARATKAVLEMVRSRRRAGLEKFTFGSQAPLGAKRVARLEKWRTGAGGIRVRTVCVPPERAHLTRADYINMILWEDEF